MDRDVVTAEFFEEPVSCTRVVGLVPEANGRWTLSVGEGSQVHTQGAPGASHSQWNNKQHDLFIACFYTRSQGFVCGCACAKWPCFRFHLHCGQWGVPRAGTDLAQVCWPLLKAWKWAWERVSFDESCQLSGERTSFHVESLSVQTERTWVKLTDSWVSTSVAVTRFHWSALHLCPFLTWFPFKL